MRLNFKLPAVGDLLLFLLVISIFCFDGDARLVKILYVVATLFIINMVPRIFRAPISTIYMRLNFPFIIVCFLSILWSADRSFSLQRCITLLINFVLFYLVWLYIYENKKEKELIRAIAIAGGIFAVYIIMYYGGFSAFMRMIATADVKNRIGGDVAHLSLIGQSLAISGIATSSVIAKTYKKSTKFVYIIIYIIELIVELASQSRTGLAILIIGSFVIYALNSKTEKPSVIISKLIIVLLFCVLAFRVMNFFSVMGRWEGLFSSTHDASTNIRFGLIKEGLQKFIERPIGGYGIAASNSISMYKSYFHNNYVELLATTGIAGFCSFYYVYVLILKNLRRKMKNDWICSICFVLIIAQLMLMIGTVTYYVKYQYLITLLGISLAFRHEDVV